MKWLKENWCYVRFGIAAVIWMVIALRVISHFVIKYW